MTCVQIMVNIYMYQLRLLMFNNIVRMYLLVGIFQLNVNFLGNFVLFGYDSTSYLLYITEVKRLKNKKEQ